MKKQIDFKGVTLSYSCSGKGKTVVLLHGFGEDHRIFEQQIELLKRNYFVIAPDLPGSGASEYLEVAATMDDYAGAIDAIINQEGCEHFVFIGHSMGGYIALAYAENFGDKLTGLGLYHSSSEADDEEKIASREKSIAFIERKGAAAFLEETIPKMFSESTKEKNPELIQQTLARYRDFNPLALIQYYRAMIQRPDRSAILKAISCPVLFIAGEQDTVVPVEKTLRQVSLPEFSYIHISKTAGHLGMIEDPGSCNPALEAYLNEI